jgi:hypothetical protein
MLEIHPVSPSFPVIKPKKIKRDDDRPENQRRKEKPKPQEPDAIPVQHIDEIV